MPDRTGTAGFIADFYVADTIVFSVRQGFSRTMTLHVTGAIPGLFERSFIMFWKQKYECKTIANQLQQKYINSYYIKLIESSNNTSKKNTNNTQIKIL